MKKILMIAALMLPFAAPVLAQQAAPAAQPSLTTKAMDAAGKMVGTAQPATQAPAKVPLVNINSATPAALDALPQIGEARTKAIVAGRPYKSTHELVDRKILPAGVYDVIKDKIAVK